MISGAEALHQAPVGHQREQPEWPALAMQLAAKTLEELDLVPRGNLDRDDAGLDRVAKKQPIAVELLADCFVSVHSGSALERLSHRRSAPYNPRGYAGRAQSEGSQQGKADDKSTVSNTANHQDRRSQFAIVHVEVQK